jgi:Trp operon repressor
MQYKTEYAQEFEQLIHKLAKSKTLLHEFLFDILSPTEYKDLSIRWQIVKQLNEGTPHREIAKNLKVSVTTVTRGSRELANLKGGFQQVLNKYYKKPR